MSVMIDSYKIGHHMRTRGIAQGELADRMGVDRKTVNTYLRTGIVKKPALLPIMAEALGVEVEWLMPQNSTNQSVGGSMKNSTYAGVAGHGNRVDVKSSSEEEIERLKRELADKDKQIQLQEEIIKLLKNQK